MKFIKSIRGMHDILPSDIKKWQSLEKTLQEVSEQFGYNEIRMPVLEHSSLFKRTIGNETDIVSKEMYSFSDRNGDELTLRPEGTASCVRAVIEHSLIRSPGARFWYCAPMFRHERPQKARYRQFFQFGLEAFGMESVAIELEMLNYCHNLWQMLDITDKVSLEINCIGSSSCRMAYHKELTEFFSNKIDLLSADEITRLENNPLRLLDSKNPIVQELLLSAPKLIDYINKPELEKFNRLCSMLDQLDITYKVNHLLVRGLDYYSGLVFEWVASELGAQATICAGGRYDDLLAILGDKKQPAIGLAMGLERILTIMPAKEIATDPIIYVIALDDKYTAIATKHANSIRAKLKVRCIQDAVSSSLKNKLKRAVKEKAIATVLIGADEVDNDMVTIKFINTNKEQKTILAVEMLDFLASTIGA